MYRDFFIFCLLSWQRFGRSNVTYGSQEGRCNARLFRMQMWVYEEVAMIKNTVEDVFSVGTWPTPLCFSLELISFLNKIPTRKREELPVSPLRISCGLPHNFSLKSLQNQNLGFFVIDLQGGFEPNGHEHDDGILDQKQHEAMNSSRVQCIVFSNGVGSDCTIYNLTFKVVV